MEILDIARRIIQMSSVVPEAKSGNGSIIQLFKIVSDLIDTIPFENPVKKVRLYTYRTSEKKPVLSSVNSEQKVCGFAKQLEPIFFEPDIVPYSQYNFFEITPKDKPVNSSENQIFQFP